VEHALDTAARAPSLKNLQPWRWHVDDDGVHLYADWQRRAGDALADRRDVLLGCGAVLDHCAMALSASGLGPRVHRFPYADNDSHLAILEMVSAPPDESYVELAAAIPRRRADRRPFTTPRLAGTLELLHIRAARMQVELAVVPRLRWTRLGNGAVTLSYGETDDTRSDAWDDDAAMLVLGTSRDDDLMRLRAGEALSRIVLTAAAMGLATCPLTEPLNDQKNRVSLACEVFDGESHPQALIRLGLPVSDADPPPLVPRRPLNETTTWGADGLDGQVG
jgi:nitroreductase